MIEEKTANTILEKEIEVDIKGKKHKVKPPSVATLIETSRLISKLPWVDSNTENILSETLRTARDTSVLGQIAATIILGVKKNASKLRGLFLKSGHDMKLKKLSEDVLELTPRELNKLMSTLLSMMEIGDFFGLTTSLSEVNLLKPTREVG